MSPTLTYINDLLYGKEDGLLIKYRFKQGLDPVGLDKLYEVLEELKKDWQHKDSIPKAIIYELVGIVPALYRDLPMYANKPEFHQFEELIYCLDNAIAMCVNPNTNDPHFSKPLKELGW